MFETNKWIGDYEFKRFEDNYFELRKKITDRYGTIIFFIDNTDIKKPNIVEKVSYYIWCGRMSANKKLKPLTYKDCIAITYATKRI